MPTDDFTRSMPFVLRWEGGFVDHPADPGGATNKGVTQAVYDRWRARQGLPQRSVRQLEEGEMNAIYRQGYWTPPRCDLLPTDLALVQFDTAVNMGPGRAVRFLQHAVGVAVDGDFGQGTRRAVDSADGGVLARYCDRREQFYRAIVAKKPSQKVFMKGWMNRLNALRAAAGLPGFESVGDTVDFGDADYIARVPEDEDDPSLD